MNASDRLNTCKSRGNMERSLLPMTTTGGWVRNAYATCLIVENNPEKSGLMFHTLLSTPVHERKDLSL